MADKTVVPFVVQTAPQHIYLQIADDAYSATEAFPEEALDQVTWCAESAMETEVKYIRADLVAEAMEHDKALREALGTCERWFTKHSPTAPLIGGHGEAEHPMLTMLRAVSGRCAMADKTVDVLAVLDRIQQEADQHPFNPIGHVVEHNIGADRVREARAAIAKLMKAAKPLTSAAHDSGLMDDILSGLRPHEVPSVRESIVQLDAALRAVGGAK